MEVREASAAYGGLIEIAIDEVPVGYKWTEVGVIPEDWDTVKLGTHATFRTGPFGSALHKSDYVHGGIPVINPMQIVDGTLVPTASMTISDAAARRLSEFLLREGEVVIGRRGDMGRCAFVGPGNKGWLCGTGSMIVQPKPSLDGRFAQRFLSSAQAISAIEATSVGTTMINLNQSTLKNLLIPIPPSRIEQEAIAEALSDADALIESLEQLLTKKRQIKQGTMQELLTGKKRLPGFIGEVDSQRLDELGRWVGGMTPSMSNHLYWQPGIIPWISSGDVKSPRLMVTSQYVTALALKDHATTLVPEKSVVVVMRSGILRKFLPVTMNMIPMTINQDLKALIPGNGICPEYVLHALIGSGSEILARCLKSGTTVESIEFGWLKSFTIRVPPFAEQAMIAAVLTDMDTELDELETRIAKNHALKQGMMQELLTGRIRLT